MIKIRTGYGADQYIVISDEEAHIAYYLFAHPEARAIFSNGYALRGTDIQGIEPAWHEMMGWNPTHKIDSDDWNEIKTSKIAKQTFRRMEIAKLASAKMTPQDFRVPLPVLAKRLEIKPRTTEYVSGQSVGEMLRLENYSRK
jgi:hypothetical protein